MASEHQSPFNVPDPRFHLAAERTLLAWLRTSLAMMGIGFLVSKFGLLLREMVVIRGGEPAQTPRLSFWIGSAMVLLSVVIAFAASWEHYRILQRLQFSFRDDRSRILLCMGTAIVIGIIGLIMAVYLLIM